MSGPRDLVLIGAGGFGRETAQAVAAINADGARWNLRGFLDDDPARRGKDVDGTPVLGGRELIGEMPAASFVVCTGRPGDYASRPRIVRELGLAADRYATIIHPAAAVAPSSRVGPGSVLLAHVTLTAAVTVGAHVAIMPQVTLTHDVEVADFATLASGASTGGGARIGAGAYLGAGALLREGTRVGDRAMVGMGSVVLRDIPPGEVWAGVPARRLRAC